jgi:hypothetical protein
MSKPDNKTRTRTNTLSTVASTDSNTSTNLSSGSIVDPKTYVLKRWNLSDTHHYLYNFYKYWKNEGITSYLTFKKPELRVPGNCKLDEKLEKVKITMDNIVSSKNLKELKDDNYIIFAIDKCNIFGFFVGKITRIVDIAGTNKKKITFTDIKQDMQISSEFNNKDNDNRILNDTQTKTYLEYINGLAPNKCNYDIFKKKWLVLKISKHHNCLNDILKSQLASGGRRKSLNKTKKYARKTIRKHKSRKNRN